MVTPIFNELTLLLLKNYILKQKSKESTAKLITTAILICNESVHSVTNFTPFSHLYGLYDKLNFQEISPEKQMFEDYNEHRK